MLLRGIISAIVISVVLTGLSIAAVAQREKGVKVAVAIDILKPIAYSIVGDIGEVYSIVPEGAEPHEFTLTPSIVREASSSDLIVITGHMEWEMKLVERIAEDKHVQPYSISLNLLNLTGIRILMIEGKRNIHGFWLLPDNAVVIAEALVDKLSKLRPGYSEEFSSNLMTFKKQVSNLKAFLNELSKKYGSSGKKVVTCFYAEQYVAEAMGLEVGSVLVGEEGMISSESLSRVYDGLKAGEYAFIIASDTALLMSGVRGALKQVSRETGCSVAYVLAVTANGLEKYDDIMYYNAGQVFSALLSEHGSASTGFDIYLLTTIIALLIIVLETVLLVKGKVRI